MVPSSPISRRLLLGRLGSGTGIVGTFLLPGRMRGALAAAAAGPGRSVAAATAPLGKSAPLVMLDPGHGGTLGLEESPTGARFRITIPDRTEPNPA